MNLFFADSLRFVAALSILCVACTTNVTNNDGSDGGGGGSTPVPVASCTARCTSKATGCGAPAARANEGCSTVCNGTYTNDQLACLEGQPCDKLMSNQLDGLCPDSGSSGAATTHFACSLNGTCYKCNDSEGVKKCSLATGPGPGCSETAASYCKRD